ncbi:MAG TPA: hypothetical protein DEG10_12300 [Leclercia adecarboxylata]|nr:hypothetical protein [Leclercia adecarboxylata]
MQTPQRAPDAHKRALIAGSIGNFIEWYEFAVYGFLATVIAKNFFQLSGEAGLTSLILTYASFAIAFFFRPLGAIVFGRIGDRIGRKPTLIIVLVMMTLATAAIGLVPVYASIGIAAPLIITVLRILQGLFAGGEYGGAVSLMTEFAPRGKRGLYGAWQSFTVALGLLAGAGIVALLSALLTPEALHDWGWRIPFLLAGPLGWIGLYLRNHLQDSPEFQALLNSHQTEAAPLRRAVITGRRALGFCIGFVAIKAVMHWMLQAFIPAYLVTTLHYPALDAYTITTLGLLFVAVLVPFMGYLSDRIGRKPLMLAGCLGLILFAWPAMKLLASGEVFSAMLGLGLLGLCIAAFDGASNAAMAELFPTRIRFGGVAIAYNLAVAFFGGVTPWSLAWLLTVTGNPLSPALYVMMAALVTLLTVLRARETAGQRLRT